LENPLSYLLIVVFMLVFYYGQSKKRYVFWLALVAGLATLNRMDTLLLFAPALILVLYRYPNWRSVKAILLGFSPFVCWEVFSLWYYGFLFPNTAYAKLNTGIESGQLLQQGIGYLISSFMFDPVLFLTITASILLILLQRDWTSLPFVIGLALYMLYTVKVGGDFMAGRFLTEPYLIAVVLLARALPPFALRSNWMLALAVIVFAAVLTPNSRWYTITTAYTGIDARGVADERSFYADATSILNIQRDVPWPNHPWTVAGLQAGLSHQRVVMEINVGYFGFAAGPNVHIVDSLALADPLLARLPAQPGWRIGHFARSIPAGYVETLEGGRNVIQNRNLALYYSKLQYVIRGPLFDFQRLIEIVKLNTGAYNYLLKGAVSQGATGFKVQERHDGASLGGSLPV